MICVHACVCMGVYVCACMCIIITTEEKETLILRGSKAGCLMFLLL